MYIDCADVFISERRLEPSRYRFKETRYVVVVMMMMNEGRNSVLGRKDH